MEITIDDINNLEKAIQEKTSGYFFGKSYSHFQEDSDFIAKAKEILRKGESLFYRSSW